MEVRQNKMLKHMAIIRQHALEGHIKAGRNYSEAQLHSSLMSMKDRMKAGEADIIYTLN